jgi:type II restriction enzyme
MNPKKTIGDKAEKLVCGRLSCPRCKRGRTLRRLPPSFPCADVICSFCGYVAQVKAHKVADAEDESITKLIGGSWRTQKERIDAGIYLPIYVVLHFRDPHFRDRMHKIFYLGVEHQFRRMFIPRKKPLRGTWRFDYHFDLEINQYFVQVYDRSPEEDERGRIRLIETTAASFSQNEAMS